jgi:hypothetical protein
MNRNSSNSTLGASGWCTLILVAVVCAVVAPFQRLRKKKKGQQYGDFVN